MGFGWMFLGYCLLLQTGFDFWGVPVDITPDIIGFFLMLKGFNVASESCDCFKLSRVFAMIGIPVSLAVTALDLLINMDVLTLPLAATMALSYVNDLFRLTFTLVLLYGLYLISTQVEYQKTRKKAARCAIYTVIFFFVAQSIGTILGWFGITPDVSYVGAIASLADTVCILINATLIFDCYRQICLEGDEDMPDNRDFKYKTPFDYFERRRAIDEAEKAKKYGNKPQHQHKKKK